MLFPAILGSSSATPNIFIIFPNLFSSLSAIYTPLWGKMEASRGDVNVLRVARRTEPIEKSADDAVLTEVWESMRPKLHPCMLKTLRSVLFFSHATNIQRMAVPLFSRAGTSVIVEASTGSGKTLSFLLPVLHRIMHDSEVSVAKTGLPVRTKDIATLVLSPSRTLSRQTFIICRQLVNSAAHNVKIVTWGDTNTSPDKEMKKFDKIPKGGGTIVVATPQSVLEVLRYCKRNKRAIRFADNATIVIDEADVVLDKSYSTVQKVLELIDEGRTVPLTFGLFGATVQSTSSVKKFISERGLRSTLPPKAIVAESIVPVERDAQTDAIIVQEDSGDVVQDPSIHKGKIYKIEDKSTTLINLRNTHLYAPSSQALTALIYLLNKHPKKKHFIFFNNSETLEYIAAILREVSRSNDYGVLWQVNTHCLHAGVSEVQRSKRFNAFLNDENGILLSTDECAFGIDVREVDYVLHFQPPNDSRVYTHRIGRTGRMGCIGTSVLLLPWESKEALGPFIDEIVSEFNSEEYKIPAGIFNAAPLVANLLAGVDELRALAIEAACVAIAEDETSSVRLQDKFAILGIGQVCQKKPS